MASDFLARASAAYLAESFISLVLAIILIYYYKIYKRQFLLLWAVAWAAGVINLLALCAIIANWNTFGHGRHIASFLATYFQSAQLLLLLFGSAAIVFKKNFSNRQIALWAFSLLILSLCVTLPFMNDLDGELERYVLRVGFRYFSILIGFIAAGVIINRQQHLAGTIGRKLIAWSFVLFGAYQFYYLLIVAGNVTGNRLPLPLFFGIIEIVLMALIGLSMVVYLLEEEHGRLTSTNEELANFLYRTSHDLRSPIATILSVLMVARNYPTTVTQEETLNMIENRVRKLDKVINDISRMTVKAAIEIKYEIIDIQLLIKDLFEEARLLDGGDDVRFELSTPHPNKFKTDQFYLRAVLSAVLENAVRYRDRHKDQSKVAISIRKESATTVFEIWDNGQGIHTESLPLIFNMFYRSNTEIDGTGLGLYLVHSMTRKLGGKVEASSVYGEYSKFTITLPG